MEYVIVVSIAYSFYSSSAAYISLLDLVTTLVIIPKRISASRSDKGVCVDSV